MENSDCLLFIIIVKLSFWAFILLFIASHLM